MIRRAGFRPWLFVGAVAFAEFVSVAGLLWIFGDWRAGLIAGAAGAVISVAALAVARHSINKSAGRLRDVIAGWNADNLDGTIDPQAAGEFASLAVALNQ